MRHCIIYASIFTLVLNCLFFFGCHVGKQKKNEINVFAAISLSNALMEIGKKYSEKNDVTVFFNFAASTTLQRQLEKGASADIFISASSNQVDALEELNLLDTERRTDILSNQLVLIAHKNARISLRKLSELNENAISKIAIGQPEIVPAGYYAKETLMHSKLWIQIQSKLIFGTDVRATLAFVSTGNATVAFVYETDTKVSDEVKVIYRIPPNTYSPITYPAVVLKDSLVKLKAQEFIDFLNTPIAITIFDKYGFTHQSTDTVEQNSLKHYNED